MNKYVLILGVMIMSLFSSCDVNTKEDVWLKGDLWETMELAEKSKKHLLVLLENDDCIGCVETLSYLNDTFKDSMVANNYLRLKLDVFGEDGTILRQVFDNAITPNFVVISPNGKLKDFFQANLLQSQMLIFKLKQLLKESFDFGMTEKPNNLSVNQCNEWCNAIFESFKILYKSDDPDIGQALFLTKESLGYHIGFFNTFLTWKACVTLEMKEEAMIYSDLLQNFSSDRNTFMYQNRLNEVEFAEYYKQGQYPKIQILTEPKSWILYNNDILINFKNVGSAPLKINKIAHSFGGQVEWSRTLIQPNQEGSISFSYIPKQKENITKEISIYSNEKIYKKTIVIP